MAFNLNNEFPPILRQYALYQRNIKGLSNNTVSEYCLDLRTFFRFMKKHKNLVDINIDDEKIDLNDIDIAFINSISTLDIYEFMNFVSDEKNNKSSTRQRKSTTLKSFFTYMYVHEKLISQNPTENMLAPKKAKPLPRYLSLEQSVELLGAIDKNDENFERDFCIITLFLNCGLRLSELVGLNLSSFQHRNNKVSIFGKGNKERIVYLNEKCLDAVEEYIGVRPVEGIPNESKNALFISKQKKRISPKTVQYIVKKYLAKIGLQDYSVHKLRHTAATLMYQYGNVDIRVLQEVLGHENLATTEIYTHTSNKQIQDAVNTNPLNNIEIKKDE